MVKRGPTNFSSHEMEKSNAIRVPMAISRPNFRAVSLFSSGSFPASTAMKMMLSMPNTISITVSVPRAIQALGSCIQ